MSYYEELGIAPDASNEEIRSAFRKKAKQHHPDRGGSAEKMAKTNIAYETLITPQRRLTYDRTGEDRPVAVDKIAEQLVISNIMAWFASERNSGDMIADVTSHLNNEQTKFLKQIVDGSALVARLTKRLKKLTFRGKGYDPVRAAASKQINEVRQQIERIRDQAATHDRAKELLKNYEFEVEPPESATWVFRLGAQRGPLG